MLKNCRHICVIVSDLERALHFYTKVLDLKIVTQRLEENDYVHTLLGLDKLHYTKLTTQEDTVPVLELYWFPEGTIRKPKVENTSLHHISFTVEKIGDIFNKLTKISFISNGMCKPLSKPTLDPVKENYVMFARDPDNNLIEFVQPREKEMKIKGKSK